MPTFCRHNRFIERCPICSKTLPGHAGGASREGGARKGDASRGGGARSGGAARRASAARAVSRLATSRPRATDVRVYVDGRRRGLDDGYGCDLVPGLRSSQDARRLLAEIGFAAGRLRALAEAPPGPYAAVAELGRQGDLEGASWLGFLVAYLSPLNGEDPFAGISSAPPLQNAEDLQDDAIEALSLGPRTCHRQGHGAATLRAYLGWAKRAGSQRRALSGEGSWSAERRFERIFERLAIPGFPRWGRYELLVMLGALGLYELRADSLHLAAASAPRSATAPRVGAATAATGALTQVAAAAEDPVLAAAKRIFAIGETLLLERRAQRLAEELAVPLEALELGLYNWLAPQRATLGFPEGLADERALARGALALGL